MEQPSYNNVITSDSFTNGRPLAASGSSSSATSSNGTPSHSYKGSFSPSSPSSDEFSVSNDIQQKQSDRSSYGASIPLSKQVTNCNIMADGLHTGSHNLTGPTTMPKYLVNVQTSDNFSRTASYNQNIFSNTVDGRPNIDNTENARTGNPSKGVFADVTESFHIGLPAESLTQLPSQLPNNTLHAQIPSASFFFKDVDPHNSVDFTSSGSNSAKALSNPSSSSNYVSKKNDYSRSTDQINSTSRQNYIPSAILQNPVLNHLQLSSDEQIQQFTQPVDYQCETNKASPYAKFSRTNYRPVPPQQPVQDQQSLQWQPSISQLTRTSQFSQQQQLPQSQYTISQSTMSLFNQAFVPKTEKPPPVSTMTAATTTSYQNVALQPNSQQPFLNNQYPHTNRSQFQSPLHPAPNTNLTSGQGMSNPSNQNFSNMSNNHAIQNYGIRNQQVQHSQSSMSSQPNLNNRTYQVNGHQPIPSQDQGQVYEPSYQNIPQQLSNRYPGGPLNDTQQVDSMARQFGGLNVSKQGFYGVRGIESCDLLRMRDILPKQKIQAPSIQLPPEIPSDCNCNPDVFRSTLTKIPETKALLDKSRLPLGILLHPFRDLTHLSVIQCSTIVRCRACRTYINPFVYFIDNRHWKCNLCFRANELPDDFRYNPLTKMHDDPLRRPEVKNATIEFIASSEYMVRPPQPAVYLFVLDVSRIATQTGYLSAMCEILSANLSKLPGDSRTSVGFITVDSAVRFYDLGENLNQPHELIVTDVDDVFIPFPENLIVNLHEHYDLIKDLLEQIPKKFKESYDTNFALGAALQAAYKLMAATGGRVTVFLSCLPNHGPGALKAREEPSQRVSNKGICLNPATDFYKKLALECNSQHVAVDLFIMNAQFVDIATISGISQVSGGCMNNFPLYSSKNPKDVEKFVKTFERYLTRKIGFEAVMRMRCSKGLSIHSFHGNFFVRTTDLLALPNINPDAGFGMQISIDENLSDMQNVCFQAALLYTSSKGERRIRVHTLCLPVTNNLHDVLLSADQQCIAGLLAKMAVDRSLHSSVGDAREAFVNVVCDILNAYKLVSNTGHSGTLFAPINLSLFPLYILALMKSVAFRLGESTRTDDRVYSMYQMKCIPLDRLIQIVHPDLYLIHNLSEQPQLEIDGKIVPMPSLVQLSAERINSTGVYLLDEGESIMIFICHNASSEVCQNMFGCPQFTSISENLNDLPIVETQENKLAHAFISYLQSKKPNPVIVYIIKDTAQLRTKFFEKLIEDKTELGVSYYEFLQTVSSQRN